MEIKIRRKNIVTKVGLFISLVGGVFLLGYGVFWSLLIGIYGFLIISIFGGIGIVGVMLAYYKGTSSAKRYLSIGMFYGLMGIILIFKFFLVDLIVGFLVIFIGSIIAYIGWHKERYFMLKSEKKEKKTMKKSYVFLIFLVISISVELILVVLLFYFPEFDSIIYILMVVIPIAILLTYFLVELNPFLNQNIGSPIEQRPLTYKEFQLANPYFCESCSKYTSFMKQQCENCGAENSLRKTIKKDYNQYRLKHEF